MIYTDTTTQVPVSLLESESAYDFLVCEFCCNEVSTEIPVCGYCGEYKGVMTVESWEAYTGESWD